MTLSGEASRLPCGVQAQLSDDVMQAEREGKVSAYCLVAREAGRSEGREDGARGGGGVGTDGAG